MHQSNIPIRPSLQHMRFDKNKINPIETPIIYKIYYQKENAESDCYMGIIKRKIKHRIKEHIHDGMHKRSTSALLKVNKTEYIYIYIYIFKL